MNLSELEIHHIGCIVPDLDNALDYLRSVYGFEADEPYYFRPDRVWIHGKEAEGYCLKIAMIHSGTKGILEVIEPVSGNGVHRQFLEAGNRGIQHICYSVKEYDRWHSFFEKRNADVVFEAEVEDDRFGYRRCFYAEDHFTGMMIEIKEEPYFRSQRI